MDPQILLRLRVLEAHEEGLLQRAPSATPMLHRQQNQVTFSKFIQLGAPLGLHYSQVAWACPYGVYPLASLAYLTWAPLGLHHPQAARVRPSGMYRSYIYLELACPLT